MRIIVSALLLAISAPAFADKPVPPYIGISPGEELELPSAGSRDLNFTIVRHEEVDADPQSSCTLTQGSHHVEGTGDVTCKITVDSKAGFVPGPATYSARTNVSGAWSEPSKVELQLVARGNLWAQVGSSQGLLDIGATASAMLAHGKLSFMLYGQTVNDWSLPMSPYLGRVSITIPANGKIDQVVSIDARWLEPLAKSKVWAHSFSEGSALLTAKAIHVTGTYSANNGAELVFEVPGSEHGRADISFRPAGYKVKAGFIDCEKLSPEQRKMHSVCN